MTILDFIEILKFLVILENKKERIWREESNSIIREFIKRILTLLVKPNDNMVEMVISTYIILLSSLCSSFDEIDITLIHAFFDYIFIKKHSYFLLIDEIRFLKSIKIKSIGVINLIEISEKYMQDKITINEKQNIEHMLTELIKLSSNQNYDVKLPILYPFDYTFNIVHINKVEIISSNSNPKLITATITNTIKIKSVHFIIKNDPGMRKEQIASSLIKVVQYKLYQQTIVGRLKSCKDIPTYNIKMITSDIAIIEFVEDSVTLRTVHESGQTLQNYILEMNLNQPLINVRNKFSQSLALSSCISYFMCLGDRHMDNIMINREGQIFHIDYGYLMSFPPYTILNTSNIKITTAMVDLLGGLNSESYNHFVEYTIELYDNIRLFRNIIIILYEEIAISSNLDWIMVEKKLNEKFMIGLTRKNIKTVIANEIETSASSYANILSDYYYYYKKKLIK
jgi:phosphatidylinositol 3-kinase